MYRVKQPLILIFALFFVAGPLICILYTILLAPKISSNLKIILLLASIVPPSTLVIMAYDQLNSLIALNTNDNLMKLERLWHSSGIIKGRKIIDIIFQVAHRIDLKEKNKDFDKVLDHTSKEIYKLSKLHSSQQIKEYKGDFIYVLSLIEFFDTLGFLYEQSKEKEKKSIEDLFKNSTIFYYKISKAYIDHCHKIKGLENRFIHFYNLYNKFCCYNTEQNKS